MWTFIIVGGSSLDFFLKISIKFKFRCIFILDMNIYSVNIPFLILDFPSRVFFSVLISFYHSTPTANSTSYILGEGKHWYCTGSKLVHIKLSVGRIGTLRIQWPDMLGQSFIHLEHINGIHIEDLLQSFIRQNLPLIVLIL